MIPSETRALSFDAVGTLIVPHPSVGEIYAGQMADFGLSLSPALVERRFFAAFPKATKDRSIQEPEAREYAYWKSIVRAAIAPEEEPAKFDFDALFDCLWRLFGTAAPWRPVDGAAETLALLSQRYPIALLTNWDARARPVFDELGLSQRFTAQIISSEIGSEKPEPEIFNAAARALGHPLETLLHVGDSYGDDIQGATNAGARAAWLATEPTQTLPPRSVRLHHLSQLR